MFHNKTPEQRKASAAKGVATRKANREATAAARLAAYQRVAGLRDQIEALEQKLASLERLEKMSAVSATLTGKALLRPDAIAKAAIPWKRSPGVYFLLDQDEIVYVGQSVNVYARIAQHQDKKFDRYAFISCSVDALDKLESIYIHYLRPKLNGDQTEDAKAAPISFDVLLGIANA